MSKVTITTEQVHELIEQLAAMTAAASITPEIVANIFEKMRNLNDQEREKVIAVAEAKIAEIQDIGIAADHVTLDSGVTVEIEMQKKAYKVELYGRSTSSPLPTDATYYYKGLPTHSVVGTAYDSTNEVYTDYIGICYEHEPDDGNEPQHHTVMVFVKNNGEYLYSETFNTMEASGYLQEHIARAFGSANATVSYSGLMSAQDKGLLNDVVTKVFPLTVEIASSNAGTREVGDAVTPTIVLNITRKGANVASSATTSVSPSGSVSQDNRTITDSEISSGSKTYQITVAQGGQTASPANQTFRFTNYRYKGPLSAKPSAANIVAAIRALPKELSTVSTLGVNDGGVQLNANMYYLFAVKGTVSLTVKNAKSGGTINIPASDKGTATVPQENGLGSNTYSWVIVPASSNAWYFMITNS